MAVIATAMPMKMGHGFQFF
jgi:hypothetical protein